MVVLRMSTIPFNGSPHKTWGVRIGALPWSEPSLESLEFAWKRVDWTVILLKHIGCAQSHKI